MRTRPIDIYDKTAFLLAGRELGEEEADAFFEEMTKNLSPEKMDAIFDFWQEKGDDATEADMEQLRAELNAIDAKIEINTLRETVFTQPAVKENAPAIEKPAFEPTF